MDSWVDNNNRSALIAIMRTWWEMKSVVNVHKKTTVVYVISTGTLLTNWNDPSIVEKISIGFLQLDGIIGVEGKDKEINFAIS